MRTPRLLRHHDGHDHHHGHHHHGHHHHHDEPDAPPPDFSSDPAQQSLVNALRAGFNVLRVIMVALVVAYVTTGVLSVGPGEQGLIVRFGRLLEQDGQVVRKPGWSFALPEPFDEKILVPGTTQTRSIDTFVFRRRDEDRGRPLAEVLPMNSLPRPETDGAMLTGDQNLSHGIWQIEYRIRDAEAFVRNIHEAESIRRIAQQDRERADYDRFIVRLLEQAVVRTMATQRIEDVGGAGKAAVVAGVKDRLQALLDRHQSGIVVDKVVADIVYPFQVREAFDEVTNAENTAKKEKETALQDATRELTRAAGPNHAELTAAIESYGAAQTLGEPAEKVQALRDRIDVLLVSAEGDVAEILSMARSRANEIRQTAETEVAQFEFLREQYQLDPALTTMRIWNDVRSVVLGSAENELMFLPAMGPLEIWTNRDLTKLLDREKRRYEGGVRRDGH